MIMAILRISEGGVSLCRGIDRLLDPGEQIGRQWAGTGCGDAFCELGAVFDTEHHKVRAHAQSQAASGCSKKAKAAAPRKSD